MKLSGAVEIFKNYAYSPVAFVNPGILIAKLVESVDLVDVVEVIDSFEHAAQATLVLDVGRLLRYAGWPVPGRHRRAADRSTSRRSYGCFEPFLFVPQLKDFAFY